MRIQCEGKHVVFASGGWLEGREEFCRCAERPRTAPGNIVHVSSLSLLLFQYAPKDLMMAYWPGGWSHLNVCCSPHVPNIEGKKFVFLQTGCITSQISLPFFLSFSSKESTSSFWCMPCFLDAEIPNCSWLVRFSPIDLFFLVNSCNKNCQRRRQYRWHQHQHRWLWRNRQHNIGLASLLRRNVEGTHATELVLDRPGFSETFDLLDSSKWSRRWVKCFKHFKIEFESNTQNYLNGGQWSWFCLGICYSCTTSS